MDDNRVQMHGNRPDQPMNNTDIPLQDAGLSLSEVFETHRHRQWYFIKPGGNWGDYLIYAGAEALARKAGLIWTDLDFRTFDPAEIPEGAAIYLHRSGGFNPWGSQRAFLIFRKALSVSKAVVIQGPQTADTTSNETIKLFHEATSNIQSADVYFFAREQITFALLKKILPPAIKIGLDRDTAFHLTKSDIARLAELNRVPNGRYDLLVIREDNEAPTQAPDRKKGFVVMDPAEFAQSFRQWLRIHAYARSIVSNRLHSAILGAILEKPVVLMSGSYHKNKSIWEHDLRARGVVWKESHATARTVGSKPHSSACILHRSWKLRQTMMWLKGVPLK